jgi:hypothetical protein
LKCFGSTQIALTFKTCSSIGTLRSHLPWYKLWVTHGTSAGTSEIAGIGGASPSGINPENPATFTFVIPPPEDFLGNNTSDILFQNTTSGDTWFEAITNGALESWNQIGGSNTTYSVVGVGDFYGTGKVGHSLS